MLFNGSEKQIIVYGAPGTGKSYTIQNNLFLLEFDKDKDIFPVVFHHDYTYSDFTGYIAPSSESTDSIDYIFMPGPFSLALERALYSGKNVCLLLEELNRGSCAAIFGDIFQLLDRDDNGVSKFPIANSIIREYLDRHDRIKTLLGRNNIGENDIFLPSNLYIIGIMNTADQNVFTLDTAFKRRFKMRYLPIKFDDSIPKLNRLNTLSAQNIFEDGKTWSDFAQMVNSAIDSVNTEVMSIPEDKKLGPFFVEEVDVSSRQTFCDKVIYYLKNDVFKYSEQYLNASFETIYEYYVINDGDIFQLFNEKDDSNDEI